MFSGGITMRKMTTATEKRSSHPDFEGIWADAEKSDSYWETLASMQFASSIRSHLRRIDMTQAGLAERLSWKPAQLSRALRGRQNLTVRSMVKICRSLGLRLDISALPAENAIRRPDGALPLRSTSSFSGASSAGSEGEREVLRRRYFLLSKEESSEVLSIETRFSDDAQASSAA